IRGGGGHPERRAPPGTGAAGHVRRCRRAGAGHRLRAGGRPARGGAGIMSTPATLPATAAGPRGGGAPPPPWDGDVWPVLGLEQVTKSYPGQPPVVALAGVSFTVHRGELVAVVGPSGSGKSTLLHVMGTLDRPSSGRVRVTGLDVAELADRDLAVVRSTR